MFYFFLLCKFLVKKNIILYYKIVLSNMGTPVRIIVINYLVNIKYLKIYCFSIVQTYLPFIFALNDRLLQIYIILNSTVIDLYFRCNNYLYKLYSNYISL